MHRLVTALMALVGLAACTPSAPEVRWELRPGGVEVRTASPVSEVRLLREDGSVAARRELPRPADTVWMGHPWGPSERYTIEVVGAGGAERAALDTPQVATPVWLRVEAPLGQGAQLVRDGEHIAVPRVGEAALEAGLVLHAVQAVDLVVEAGDLVTEVHLGTAGQRRRLRIPLPARTEVRLRSATWSARFTLDPVSVPAEVARDQLTVVRRVFPAEASGAANPARARARVTLPAPWWTQLLSSLHLGLRAADDQAPWAWEAITLENHGDHALNLLLRGRVTDDEGRPSPVFRPRLREYDGGSDRVTALLRVPAHEQATAVLPLYVDRSMASPGQWSRELSLVPLGAQEPLFIDRTPLYLSRGSPWLSILFGGGLLASLISVCWLPWALPRWLRREPTSALMTIALFGALHFTVSVASQAAHTLLATLLGPFAIFVSGLGDTVLRTAVLVTLLTLLPRPGVATLTMITGWLLRGMVLGSFDPVGAQFLLASVVVVEVCLWLAGITRVTGWRDQSVPLRWLRLALAFGVAGALRSAIGLSASMVLYRLYYADSYVLAFVLLPGLLYPALACLPATRFAQSLRRVQA